MLTDVARRLLATRARRGAARDRRRRRGGGDRGGARAARGRSARGRRPHSRRPVGRADPRGGRARARVLGRREASPTGRWTKASGPARRRPSQTPPPRVLPSSPTCWRGSSPVPLWAPRTFASLAVRATDDAVTVEALALLSRTQRRAALGLLRAVGAAPAAALLRSLETVTGDEPGTFAPRAGNPDESSAAHPDQGRDGHPARSSTPRRPCRPGSTRDPITPDRSTSPDPPSRRTAGWCCSTTGSGPCWSRQPKPHRTTTRWRSASTCSRRW